MHLVESVFGNVRDASWQPRLDGVRIDHLHLDQWEAQKNRFRKATDGGLELAVSLERHTHLRDGDILVWDERGRTAVVAHIELNDVMVLRLDELLHHSPDQLLQTCVELGHALGNQHWPAVVKDLRVFVPLTVDRKVMASVMRTHAFHGITCEFVPGSEVIPYLAPHEARRLFGGADSTPHSHVHEHTHPHDGADHEHG